MTGYKLLAHCVIVALKAQLSYLTAAALLAEDHAMRLVVFLYLADFVVTILTVMFCIACLLRVCLSIKVLLYCNFLVFYWFG